MRELQCACCGSDAGRFKQWFNQDTGYGICARCVGWLRTRGEDEETIKFRYGVENVNFAPKIENPVASLTVEG